MELTSQILSLEFADNKMSETLLITLERSENSLTPLVFSCPILRLGRVCVCVACPVMDCYQLSCAKDMIHDNKTVLSGSYQRMSATWEV